MRADMEGQVVEWFVSIWDEGSGFLRYRGGSGSDRGWVIEQVVAAGCAVAFGGDGSMTGLRSVRHVIDTVHNLGERGIAFRSLTEGFDTTTAGGEFLFHIMAALAQMERRMIVERTHAGLAAARRQGRHGGRPPVMTPERTELARTMRE